ncbi:MAG: hydantoinase B/oxoprolinase family protein [Planctomycetes bacterium]|nr:hydantoinase B/oxoprolinase family protein [Planctomycetota bacterium]
MAAKRGRANGAVRAARLEVFDQLFASVAEEMGAALSRAAFSPNIKERRDFSCALFDARGRMVAQAAHIPIHLGSIPACVAAAREDVEMRPGDAVLLNDPYRGGTHLPDVTLVSPIFLSGKSKPDFYAANRAHHADVGGAHPGSMAPAHDLHGEGLVIPPIRWIVGGEPDRALTRLLLANMRIPREREGDLFAQWAANRTAERRLVELARELRTRGLARACDDLRGWTANLARAFVRSLPRREVSFEDVLEVGARDVALRVTLARRGDELVVDFRASDAQSDAPINTPRAVAVSAVFYVLRLLLAERAPTNDGLLAPARILTRPKSLVDARYPAPVAAGNVETSQRLVDVLLGAFARLLPGRMPAASSGTMSNLSFGGSRADGEGFTYYETIAGGAGASRAGDGASGVHTHMTNTRNTPIEAFELGFPARVLWYALRPNSGGSGEHRGGDGLVKRVHFLAPVQAGWIADRSRRGPWGLGGQRGAASRAARVDRRGGVQELGSKVSLALAAGEGLALATPGGGGFGRPRR